MLFTLNIELGNDAMRTTADVLGAIQNSLSAREGLFDPLTAEDSRKLFDRNGNTIGSWQITETAAPSFSDDERSCASSTR